MPASRISPALRWSVTLSALLVIGLLLWVFWMVAVTAGKEAARSKQSFQARTTVSASDLRRCLEDSRVDGLAIRHKGSTWQTQLGPPAVSRAENNARHTQIEVIDVGLERLLRFYTRDGLPMRKSERALITACLAGRSG